MFKRSDDKHDFYLFDEDWGLIEIIPAENKVERESVIEEITEHHKDTVFAPSGWSTSPFVICEPSKPIRDRKMTVSELEQYFAGLGTVATSESFSGRAIIQKHCFSLKVDKKYALYGSQKDGIIDFLGFEPDQVTESEVDAWAEALGKVGTAHNLIVVDWNWHKIIVLADREAMKTYLRQRIQHLDELNQAIRNRHD